MAEFRQFFQSFLFFIALFFKFFVVFRNVLFFLFSFLDSFNFQYRNFDIVFLAKSMFFTIIFITMFLKVLNNKVNLRVLTKTQIPYYWLTPFVKRFELSAINHSSSARRAIFVSWLKHSYVLVVEQLAWVYTSRHLRWITRFGLLPFPGCQGSCDIVPNRPAGSLVSFNISQGLKL